MRTNEEIISYLQCAIKEKGFTVNDALISSRAGKDLIANMKKGQLPSVEKFILLAEFLDVSLDHLIGRDDHSVHTIKGNVTGSAVIQGANNGTVAVNDKHNLTDEEIELLRIYGSFDVKKRHRLMALAFELEGPDK